MFPFGYDWRQDCQRSADQLDAFIDEVIARTWLLPHYRDQADRRVDLVGHSMGGLVIADYVSRYGGKKVRRVVSLADAVPGVAGGCEEDDHGPGAASPTIRRATANVRRRARFRRSTSSCRPTPAPSPRARGSRSTSSTSSAWQPSILSTITEYVRLHSAVAEPRALFQSYLDGLRAIAQERGEAEAGRARPSSGLRSPASAPRRLLSTDIILWPRPGKNQQPCFDFPEPKDDYPNPNTGATGDGTVPFPGACPPFLEPEQLCAWHPTTSRSGSSRTRRSPSWPGSTPSSPR